MSVSVSSRHVGTRAVNECLLSMFDVCLSDLLNVYPICITMRGVRSYSLAALQKSGDAPED